MKSPKTIAKAVMLGLILSVSATNCGPITWLKSKFAKEVAEEVQKGFFGKLADGTVSVLKTVKGATYDQLTKENAKAVFGTVKGYTYDQLTKENAKAVYGFAKDKGLTVVSSPYTYAILGAAAAGYFGPKVYSWLTSKAKNDIQLNEESGPMNPERLEEIRQVSKGLGRLARLMEVNAGRLQYN